MKSVTYYFIVICLHLSLFLNAQSQNVERAESLYNQAVDAVLHKDLKNAVLYLDEGFPLASEALRKKYNWVYGQICERYALSVYFDDYQQAYNHYERAYSYYADAKYYKNAAGVLKHMGILKRYMKKYSDALQLWDFAVKIAERFKFSPIDIFVEQKLMFEELNQFEHSLMVSSKLHDAYLASSSPDEKVKVLNLWAKDAMKSMDYQLAEAYYDEMVLLLGKLPDIKRKNKEQNTYYDRHRLLQLLGQYDKAIDMTLQMIDNVINEAGQDCFIESMYRNLAYDYACIGDDKTARKYVDDSFSLLSSAQMEKKMVASSYQFISMVYHKLGDLNKAHECLLAAEQITEADGAFSANIAGILYAKGKKQDARAEYERYAKYVESVYGFHSLQYACAMEYLANISAICKDFDSASDYYIKASALTREIVSEGFHYVTLSQRDAFWNQCSSLLLNMTSFGLKAGFVQDDFSEAAYDGLLLSKGLLLSSERSMASVIRASGDDELVETFDECQKLYTEIERNRAKLKSGTSVLTSMTDSLHNLERTVRMKMTDLPDFMSFVETDYQTIQSAMEDDEIVIDFTDFRGIKDTDRVFYAAFVYRKGWQHPRMVKAFEESELTKILGDNPCAWTWYGEKAKKAADLILSPFYKYIKNGDKVYWIPSGNLHKISVESLYMQSDSELQISFHRLSSARVIASNSQLKSFQKSALYGGLQYEMTEEDFVSVVSDMPIHYYTNQSRGEKIGFKSLPYSKEEVQIIEDVLESVDTEVDIYDGKNGTEQSFINMSGRSPDLIHMSTHGFYYTPDQASSISALAGYKDAMLLSGLVLSGGNHEWTSTELVPEYLGGLLTADDISKLDLSSTNLVVLSACGTGEGIVTSEGVYGIQRAFKKAGVKYLVLTLWQVNDFISKEFMKEFYTALVTNGFDSHLSLLSAKQSIREKYDDPYYWAGYILME